MLKYFARAIIFFFVCLFIISAQAKKSTIEKKLENISLKFSSTLLDMEFFDAFNLSLDYYYRVQPAYVDGLYSRTDQLEVKLDIDPTDLLLDNSPIYLNIKKGNKLTFIRHFRTQKEAMFSLPKSFFIKKIPVTAKKALKHLNIGEFVSFKSDLRLVIGAQLATEQGWINAGGNTHYLLSGEFEIRLFRMDEDRFKLQLVGLKKRGGVIDGKIKILENLKITGFKVIKNRIEKIISLTLLDLGIEKTREDIFLVDYDLNLKDLEVQNAYNKIIQSFTNPMLSSLESSFQIMTEKRKKESLKEVIYGNLVEIENLFDREKSSRSSVEDRLVHRNFMGQNNSRTLLSRFKVNLKLFKFSKNHVYRKNHLTTYDEDNNKQYFYLPTLSKFTERSFFWQVNQETEMISLNNLFLEDKYGRVSDLINSGYYYTYTDKKFEFDEQMELRHDILKQLPREVTRKIRWGDWGQNKTRRNARVSYELYFNKNSFKYFKYKTKLELEKIIYDYVYSRKVYTASAKSYKYYQKRCQWSRLRTASIYTPEGLQAGAICYTAHNLYKIFNLGLNDSILGDIKKVSNSEFFKEVVVGALVFQLPPEQLDRLIYFKMRWSGVGAPTLLFKYGNTIDVELFEHIMNIQSILNNQSFDWKILEGVMDKNAPLGEPIK